MMDSPSKECMVRGSLRSSKYPQTCSDIQHTEIHVCPRSCSFPPCQHHQITSRYPFGKVSLGPPMMRFILSTPRLHWGHAALRRLARGQAARRHTARRHGTRRLRQQPEPGSSSAWGRPSILALERLHSEETPTVRRRKDFD